MHKIVQHLFRFICFKLHEITIEIIKHPIKAVGKLILREVFYWSQKKRQRFNGKKDG